MQNGPFLDGVFRWSLGVELWLGGDFRWSYPLDVRLRVMPKDGMIGCGKVRIFEEGFAGLKLLFESIEVLCVGVLTIGGRVVDNLKLEIVC